jgi:hypothetical protein
MPIVSPVFPEAVGAAAAEDNAVDAEAAAEGAALVDAAAVAGAAADEAALFAVPAQLVNTRAATIMTIRVVIIAFFIIIIFHPFIPKIISFIYLFYYLPESPRLL